MTEDPPMPFNTVHLNEVVQQTALVSETIG